MLLGAFSDHGKGTILEYDMYSTYNCIALGLLSTVAALPAFGRSRLMFYREAASGLNRFSSPLLTLLRHKNNHCASIVAHISTLLKVANAMQPCETALHSCGLDTPSAGIFV